MLVTCQHAFLICEVREEGEASRAIGGDAVAVDPHRAAHELTEVIPIEVIAILEFPYQAIGIEIIARLPEL
jgi:hypothetical protein